MEEFTLLQQATVAGTKFLLVKENVFNVSHPATPLEFQNPKVQRQLELMMAIQDYASTNRATDDMNEKLVPEVELNESSPLQIYRRWVPALRSVGEILRGYINPARRERRTVYYRLK